MKLFNMDMHISVIEDFKTLGLDVEITHWCLSSHGYFTNKPQAVPKYVNPRTYFIYSPMLIEKFQKEYDSFLRTFDGFIVGHPNSYAMIFEKYNKPIILINTCRYDLPFSCREVLDTKYLNYYHACLYRLLNKNLLYTVSNNRVDQLYMGKGCGIMPKYRVHPLCLYTKMKYNPTKSTFIMYYHSKFNHPLVSPRPDYFTWPELASYRGIIYFPREAGLTMSMFEHFTAGMPMFIPSKAYWKSNHDINNCVQYWGNNPPENLREFKDEDYWIENSCMWETFASPNTIIFDSFEDLAVKLETFEYTPEGDFREKHIESVKTFWKGLIAEIKTTHLIS